MKLFRRKAVRSVALVFIAAFLVTMLPLSAGAISEARRKMFAQNNIIFYDPCDDELDLDVNDAPMIMVYGSTMRERVYNGLRNNMMAPANAVGVVAALELAHGENLNPFEGTGLFGLPSSDYAQLVEDGKVRYPDLVSFYDNRGAFSGNLTENPGISNLQINEAIAMDLYFFYTKMNTLAGKLAGINGDSSVTDANDAARMFLAEIGRVDLYGRINGKVTEILNQFSDDFSGDSEDEVFAGIGSGGAGVGVADGDKVVIFLSNDVVTSGANVLIIGDSLIARSKDTLGREAWIKNATYQAFSGAYFLDGLDGGSGTDGAIQGLNKMGSSLADYKYIVYAMGQNNCDPVINPLCGGGLTEELVQSVVNEVASKAPSAKLFFVTNYRRDIDMSANNQVLEAVASRNSGTVGLIDWAEKAKGLSSEYFTDDFGHPNARGGAILAKLIADKVQVAVGEGIEDGTEMADASSCDRNQFGETIGLEDDDDGDLEDLEDSSGPDGGGSGSGGGSGGGTSSGRLTAQQIKDRLRSYWMGQCDFSSVRFSQNNICTDGCSVTAFSMVLSILYNKKVTPSTTVNWTGSYRANPSTDVGIVNTMVNNAKRAEYSDLKVSSSAVTISQSNVDNLLSQGKMIIMSCTGGVPCARTGRSTSGHFIAIVGIDPSNPNNYLLANSAGRDPYKTRQSFSKSSVISMYKGGGRSRAVWREN